MKASNRHIFPRLRRLAIALCLSLALWTHAYGNGGHFAVPVDQAAAGLMYFGDVKDEAGNPVAVATITLEVKDSGTTWVTASNEQGHYKTTDLGKQMDPSKVVISCGKEGYRLVAPKGGSVPDKKGPVEINFTLSNK